MKKIYFAPEMEVVEIKMTGMLAASPLGWGDSVDSAEGAEAPEIQEILMLFGE